MSGNLFCCPITQEVMTTPVVAPDGNTYEKAAIVEWLEKNGISPLTRQPMSVDDLVPNRVLQDMIEKATAKNLPPPPPTADDSAMAVDEDEYQDLLPTGAVLELLKAEVKATVSSIDGSGRKLIKIAVPDVDTYKHPTHVCLVLDVSGSMNAEASCKNETGERESSDLSVLDVVKFASLVISQSLSPNDYLSIVTFSDNAKVELAPTRMSKAGKASAKAALNRIVTQGMTNLWAGIQNAVEISHELGGLFQTSILVLTDGEPNIDPPMGYIPSLERLLAKKPIFGTISTFGFGYSLQSTVLRQIAIAGGGGFNFIPDSGMVGTIFINFISNTRCQFGIRPRIILAPPPASSNTGGVRGLLTKRSRNSLTSSSNVPPGILSSVLVPHLIGTDMDGASLLYLTSLRYGHDVDVVIDTSVLPGGGGVDGKFELVFDIIGGEQVSVLIEDAMCEPDDITLALARSNFVRDVFTKIDATTTYGVTSGIKAGCLKISDEATARRVACPPLDALCKDIEGQAAEAVATADAYNRWGRHYLQSLAMAHMNQICNNFKDPGVQAYGGELFATLREELNDVFLTIPAPVGTRSTSGRRQHTGGGGGGGAAGGARRPPQSMSARYNNVRSVCFSPTSTVQLAQDNTLIKMKDLKRGDIIVASGCPTAGGGIARVPEGKARVVCVVKTVVQGGVADMVHLGEGMVVTPYHPVNLQGKWCFPADVGAVTPHVLDAVYNMVLETVHDGDVIHPKGSPVAVCVGGVYAAVLGHGITEGDDVLAHAYFGSKKVLEDLSACQGWADGMVVLTEDSVVRDPETGLICKITNKEEEGEKFYQSSNAACAMQACCNTFMIAQNEVSVA